MNIPRYRILPMQDCTVCDVEAKCARHSHLPPTPTAPSYPCPWCGGSAPECYVPREVSR